jgi:anti-sigma regulatory factor (Ser/Thr protein kinase)
MILTRGQVLELAKQKGVLFSRDIVNKFNVSRQYANLLISDLVTNKKLIKLGSTRKASYVLPEYAHSHQEIFPSQYVKSFKNIDLEEHKVLDQIENVFPTLNKLSENIKSIFTYAFSEMFNNAIEHSQSIRIGVEISIPQKTLSFTINDSGIGVFRNVMKQQKLKSEIEAIQDLLKGKTTTMPKFHSGEGIFFTSKSADLFILNSYGYQLIVNNDIPDVFVKTVKKIKRGTQVVFKIKATSKHHLSEVFKKYTDLVGESDYGFDKTEVRVKLYTLAGVHISRSQARRVLSGLEKFKIVVFDFDKVPMVGQAFADEIFRVFQNKYPTIRLETENMNEGVKFMVDRSVNEAKLR